MEDRFKFRAFLKRANLMKKCVGVLENSVILEDEIGQFSEPHNQVKLMQCTGLKDKNGNLIYEGDVLKRECEELGVALHSKHVTKLGYVRVPDNCFVAQCFDEKNHCTSICQENWKDSEIIGNIYETPELLKE